MPDKVITIDATDTEKMISFLQTRMKPAQFNRAMYGVFNRATGFVRKTAKQDIPKHYAVPKNEVGAAVKKGRVQFGSLTNMGCTIPIEGERRDFGGKHGYASWGGARGFAAVRKPYRITAQIYAGQRSSLPFPNMPAKDGGYPPFRNTSSGSRGGKLPAEKVFTRAAGAGWPPNNLPVNKVVGPAIPQMPLNKAEPDMQKDIAVYVSKALLHRINGYLATGR